jgi:hypothetical protein
MALSAALAALVPVLVAMETAEKDFHRNKNVAVRLQWKALHRANPGAAGAPSAFGDCLAQLAVKWPTYIEKYTDDPPKFRVTVRVRSNPLKRRILRG